MTRGVGDVVTGGERDPHAAHVVGQVAAAHREDEAAVGQRAFLGQRDVRHRRRGRRAVAGLDHREVAGVHAGHDFAEDGAELELIGRGGAVEGHLVVVTLEVREARRGVVHRVGLVGAARGGGGEGVAGGIRDVLVRGEAEPHRARVARQVAAAQGDPEHAGGLRGVGVVRGVARLHGADAGRGGRAAAGLGDREVRRPHVVHVLAEGHQERQRVRVGDLAGVVAGAVVALDGGHRRGAVVQRVGLVVRVCGQGGDERVVRLVRDGVSRGEIEPHRAVVVAEVAGAHGDPEHAGGLRGVGVVRGVARLHAADGGRGGRAAAGRGDREVLPSRRSRRPR